LIYCLLGDGELQEGQNWEAFMYASANKVDNIIATIDLNGQQIDGSTDDVLNLGKIRDKIESFGWYVIECSEGNNIEKVYNSKKNQTLLFIDLSVPRNINDDISSIGNIQLINIDNLKDIVNQNYNKRKAEIDKSQKIIDSFLNEFDEWANSRQLRPSILSIKNKIKILIQNNMNLKSSIENNNDENLNIKMNRIYDKLSDHLVKKIRLASNNGKDKSALEVIKKIFNDE